MPLPVRPSSRVPARPRVVPRPRPAFSLIEVVMVIVILGVIAAIAIPRLSRGSQGAAEAACTRDVQVIQKAIDLYAAEHNGAFPGAACCTSIGMTPR